MLISPFLSVTLVAPAQAMEVTDVAAYVAVGDRGWPYLLSVTTDGPGIEARFSEEGMHHALSWDGALDMAHAVNNAYKLIPWRMAYSLDEVIEQVAWEIQGHALSYNRVFRNRANPVDIYLPNYWCCWYSNTPLEWTYPPED